MTAFTAGFGLALNRLDRYLEDQGGASFADTAAVHTVGGTAVSAAAF